ncbi:GNAT family N-acetyltransferase [Patescibacteria group bacterium]|nr:GNAT family N-acetyltransferase [Patescibacteria group bacterium]MBU2633568.1 GNAT family N-acetyltransferase [Patescibacteria group bacterium]
MTDKNKVVEKLPAMFLIDEDIYCRFHSDKNNNEIFNILESEDWNFYHHTDVKQPKTIKDIDNYFNDRKIFFDIFYKNKLVGLIDFNPEKSYLSYWISTKFQNKGTMSKVLTGVSDLFLKLGLPEIFVHIKEEHLASIKVAEKSGFKLKKRKVFDKDDVMVLFVKTRLPVKKD